MDHGNFIYILLSLFSLLFISNFIYLLSKKINFPYTVLLVLVGLLLYPLSKIGIFNFIDDFSLNPQVLFFVFLPILLFEAAYNIDVKKLSKTWITISTLSILWVLISTSFIWISLYYIFLLAWFHIHILVTLLFWAIISATDPIAVIAIFKNMWAPERLTLIFEWESLFNDWTSVALFSIILWIILKWNIIWDNLFIHSILSFLIMVFWWIIFWILSWFSFSKILWKINYNEEVEISFALFSAYIVFILVEILNQYLWFFEISGIIATVVSSMIIWNYWRYKITPKSELHMSKFLKFFTYLSNSLVFILMWITMFSIKIEFSKILLPLTILIIIVIIVMLARSISILLSVKWINYLKIEKNINDDWQKLLFWWWIRWVIALIMVLMIPWVWDIWYDKLLNFQQSIWWNFNIWIKDFLLFWTIWTIIFTTFINTTTISYIMKKMWIDRLHKYEKIEYEELKIITNLKILKKLNKFYVEKLINKKEYEKNKEKYKTELNKSLITLEKSLKWNNKSIELFIKRLMFKYALWIEKSYINKYYYDKKLNEKHFKYILNNINLGIQEIDNWLKHSNNIEAFKRWLNSITLFDKLFSFMKEKYNYEDMYIIYRTKYELSKKVLKELKKLPNDELWFTEEITNFIFNHYKELTKIYKEKMYDILKNNSKNIKNLEWIIMNKYFLKLEEKLLNDLYQKELIPYKYYTTMINNIEEWLYKNIN